MFDCAPRCSEPKLSARFSLSSHRQDNLNVIDCEGTALSISQLQLSLLLRHTWHIHNLLLGLRL